LPGLVPAAQVDDGLAFIVRESEIASAAENGNAGPSTVRYGAESEEEASFTFKETSEAKLLSMGLIRLYQLFISSQDLPSCNFTLSCSRFGMSSIRKYGLFHGVLMTADRLQRCHGTGRRYYRIDLETGRAIDYRLESYYLGRNRPNSEAFDTNL
jgi:putative component of membrane protein insertase Oxa1/YidC/SpoIIIJ protein YidD